MNSIKKKITNMLYYTSDYVPPRIKKTFMKSYDIPAHLFPEAFQKFRLSEFPNILVIQTHSYCNASCIMCPYQDYIKDNKNPKGKMEPETFYKIIDECKKYNIKKISPYLMNEPLMDGNIFGYIKYIRKKIPSTKTSINSNGSALTKDKAEKLSKTGLHRIVFSVHGINEKKYNKITGLNLKKVLENIDYYLSLKKRNSTSVGITGITEWFTKKELEKWVSYWEKRDVDLEYRKLHSRAENVKVPEVICKMEKLGRKDYKNKKIYGCRHREATSKMDILFNGDVILCCMDWNRSVVLGNVKENSLYDIWNSDKFNKIREMMVSKEKSSEKFICKKCVKAIR